MIIYIDADFKCHITDDGTMRAFDVPFFDGKASSLVEGYRYVPNGEIWTRDDGIQFVGELIRPFSDFSRIAYAQKNYEEGVDSQDSAIAELMDDIEELCNEIIGE